MRTAQQYGIKSLYHYQSWNSDWIKDALVNNRVHVSNLKNVNDPWDCRPYFQISVNDPLSRRNWGERLQRIFEQIPQELRDKLPSPGTGNWYDDKELLRQSIDRLREWVWQLNVERWRIYCLIPHANSILMWSHYADGNTGICIEFDANRHPFSRAFAMKYEERLPKIGPEDFTGASKRLTEAILLTKSKAWAYEREYRIMARDRSIDPTFPVTTEDEYLAVPQGAITAIIAGCNAVLEPIRSLVREYAPGVRVKRAVTEPRIIR